MCQPFSRWELPFIDIDECTTNNPNCDINAFCNNTKVSHYCTCKPGYSGDGSICTGNDCFILSLFYFGVFFLKCANLSHAGSFPS